MRDRSGRPPLRSAERGRQQLLGQPIVTNSFQSNLVWTIEGEAFSRVFIQRGPEERQSVLPSHVHEQIRRPPGMLEVHFGRDRGRPVVSADMQFAVNPHPLRTIKLQRLGADREIPVLQEPLQGLSDGARFEIDEESRF